MCHTLLQYYIHCGHTNVFFHPCVIVPPSTPPQRDPLYARRLYIHPNYKPPSSNQDVKEEFVSSEWRDHSVPLSIAHSYHRACPDCAEEKRQQDRSPGETKQKRGLEQWNSFSLSEADRLADNEQRAGDEEIASLLTFRALQLPRTRAFDYGQQRFGNSRDASMAVARDLELRPSPDETTPQMERRILWELRDRGAEAIIQNQHGAPLRMGDNGWERLPLQATSGSPVPESQRANTLPRSQAHTRRTAQATPAARERGPLPPLRPLIPRLEREARIQLTPAPGRETDCIV